MIAIGSIELITLDEANRGFVFENRDLSDVDAFVNEITGATLGDEVPQESAGACLGVWNATTIDGEPAIVKVWELGS